jgi:hypothetical protein
MWFKEKLDIWFSEYNQCQGCGKWRKDVKLSNMWHDEGSPLDLCPDCDSIEGGENGD